MHKPYLIPVFAAALLLAACSPDPEQSRAVPVEVPTNPDGSPVTRVGPTAQFDPSVGVVPTPNNLLFTGSQDGTVNIPVADPADFTNPQVAINALDGFSTVAPMTTSFSASVDPDTVVPGQGVRILEVILCTDAELGCPPVAGPPIGVVGELVPGQDFVALINPADPTQTQLVIVPLRPLKPKAHYLVLLTHHIADAQGGHVVPSQIYQITKSTEPLVDEQGNSTTVLPDANAQALEPLRRLVNASEAVAAAAGIPRDSIVLSWVVSTQSISDVLDFVAANAESVDNAFIPTGNPTPMGAASIFVGNFTIPYGLQAPDDDPDDVDPSRILRGHWVGLGGSNLTRFNPAVVPRSEQTIPAMLTVPTTAQPAEGWPVMIFQHGITGHRGQALAIADAAAGAGFAVLSIDQPLHGIHPADPQFGPFHASNFNALQAPGFEDMRERTFDVDLDGDASPDPSGAHFINLPRLLTSRDNIRQASADLIAVSVTVPDILILDPGTGTPLPISFDGSRVHFVGHSLGGMVGIPAIATGEAITAATIAKSGGGIARLLDGSATFGPIIRDGLEAAGVVPDSPDYNAFMFAAQTVVDSGDPINYGAAAAMKSAIHFIEVAGDGTEDNPPDQVVPVSVPGHPLSGSSPLAAVMGLAAISETTMDLAGVRGIVRFTEGDHGSLLSPAASPAATVEMQTQTAVFIGSSGTVLQITDDSVVQQQD